MAVERFFISQVMIGVAPREYALDTPKPWKLVDQSVNHIT
jgi:hypothetical protein